MKKKILAFLLAAVCCFSFVACDEDYENYEGEEEYQDYDEDNKENSNQIQSLGNSDQTWSIYWYLCGSDLESFNKAGTKDIAEMMNVELPENVQIIIETGGAYKWHNDDISSDLIGRYVYNSDGFSLIEQKPSANMGDSATLTEFLKFCKENYPADKTMVLFWNHGGGSVTGVEFDELFGNDSLTLTEIHQAFDSVFDLSTDKPPFEIVGFDTCLMSTIDTADTFSDIANYMVASEEFEPGGGWEYSKWIQKLADQPEMNGSQLGKFICDSYMDVCKKNNEDNEATLSVVDLTKVAPLVDAYEKMGAEALKTALDKPSFFSNFGREATRSENYGGNTREQGYSNMVDLGDLAKNCAQILPEESQAVLDGLKECVIYKVNGKYRKNSTGLSCYYSYNSDKEDFEGYKKHGCSKSFKYLFGYELDGKLPDEGMEYINNLGYENEELPEVPELGDTSDKIFTLFLDDEDFATMELDADTVDMLKNVYFQLAYINEEEDTMYMLGQDNDIVVDWDNGVFKDNFRKVWGSIDGHIVYMEISYESDDYVVYSIPILLNDEEYNLRVVYDYNDGEFYIMGARKGLDDNGKADKNLRQLEPGDEITTIHFVASASGDDDFQGVTAETFTVTENTAFNEMDLGDGIYQMMFELVDFKNNTAYSEVVQFTLYDGNMDIEILD